MRTAQRAFLALFVLLLAGVSASFRGGEQTVLAETTAAMVEATSPPAKVPRKTTDAMVAQELIHRDLPQIKGDKTLRVLAPYNSTTYFIYRGEPMGYEYELLQRFAKDMGLTLKIVVSKDGEALGSRLRRGEGDIIAAAMVPPAKPEAADDGLAFTKALYRTKPTVVQQRPGMSLDTTVSEPVEEVVERKEGADALERTRMDARLITRPFQLVGHQVHVPQGHPYRETLVEVADEASGDIHVVQVRGTGTEGLIERVAKGEVFLTVAPKNLAELKESVYSNIEVIPTLDRPHPVAWAVRRNSPELMEALNAWIEKRQDTPLFKNLYRKYYLDRRRYKDRVQSEYLTSRTGKLCRYDPLLKAHAPEIDWDWRMLAALAYQESRFKADAHSWAGAAGLMQLMPATAREVGVRNRLDPRDNVRGGVKYIRWLQKYWQNKITDEEERKKFVLASYNAGAGHVEDAQRLARKFGDNPAVWNDVAYWMLQLSQKKFYSDPVVRHGYVRGLEPVNYVGQILERFEHYRQFVTSA